MRITNQIVSGNSLRNMQKSMSEVNKRTQQLTTGKKISRASEDPVIAIRALKLRTTVTQLEQYKGKNIPDANSWYEITQTSLDTITDKIKGINDYCVQGSTDSFGTSDRSAIIDGLKQLRDMIFSEGNATYAGRYIFSGYKTDRSLVFVTTEDNSKYSYDITQHFTADDMDTKNTVLNEIDYTKLDGYLASGDANVPYEQPNPETVYRLNLGYDRIEQYNNDGTKVLSLKAKDAEGKDIDLKDFTVKEAGDVDTYYKVGPDDINIIKETGEIIFGENVYNTLKTANDIQVTYSRKDFKPDELRPEHFFDCIQYAEQPDGTVKKVQYEQPPEGQAIYYEVNFNQSVQVNTEGNKIINTKVGNDINDLIYALQDMEEAEKAQKQLKFMLTDPQYANDAAVNKINQMLSDLDVELAVKKENMQKKFSQNIKNFQDYMNQITAVQSDLGSRMTKLSMIEVRVKEQYASFKELKSVNEDTETDSAVIDFKEAGLVYESALAATSNVMRKTLLDYI